MKQLIEPQLGQIVQILRGRDQDQFAIIVGIVDEKFVLIADGHKRKFDQPKKKNILHLALTDTISSEVEASLMETGKVTNGKLRFAIGKHMNTNEQTANVKGE